MRTRFLRLALTGLCVGQPLAVRAQASPTAIRNHFETDAAMRAPAFFDFVELGAPGAADWVVMADSNPPSTPNILVQGVRDRPADAIAVAIRRNVSFRDGRVSVALKRGSGRGGLLLRMASEKDFLVLLVDLRSGDARLLSYRGGKASELAHAVAPQNLEWGVLAVTASAAEVNATWAGKPLLSATDPQPAAGRAGLATAGPGNAGFDELILESVDPK